MCDRLSRVQERRARQTNSQSHSPGHRSNDVVPSSRQQFKNPVHHIEASESPSHASDRIQDEERNGLEIAAAALGQPEGVGQVPFYTGTLDLYLTFNQNKYANCWQATKLA